MNNPRSLSRFLGAALLGLLLLEVGAHVTASFNGQRAALFQLDQKVGWVKRDRSESFSWVSEKDAPNTLILGDSFVFGEGVRLEERFDQQMIQSGYTHRIINRGVSGYSTDQELIAATQDLERLKAGDTVVLVTFGDDLRGLISSIFAGRLKPRYHFVGGDLQLKPPSIGWIDRIREWSYLIRAFKKIVGPRSATTLHLGEGKLSEAMGIYHALLLERLGPVAERGVKVVIVFHGQNIVDSDFGPGFGQRAANDIRQISQQLAFTFLDLGDELEFKRYQQSSGAHWNAEGHRRFAELLVSACDKSNNQIHLSQKESR